jgi:hypothetical protein
MGMRRACTGDARDAMGLRWGCDGDATGMRQKCNGDAAGDWVQPMEFDVGGRRCM